MARTVPHETVEATEQAQAVEVIDLGGEGLVAVEHDHRAGPVGQAGVVVQLGLEPKDEPGDGGAVGQVHDGADLGEVGQVLEGPRWAEHVRVEVLRSPTRGQPEQGGAHRGRTTPSPAAEHDEVARGGVPHQGRLGSFAGPVLASEDDPVPRVMVEAAGRVEVEAVG